MEQQDFDALSGRVEAISMSLLAVIQTLSPLQAATAAAALAVERETQRLTDSPSNSAGTQARDDIVDGYLGLLRALS